MTLDDFDKAKKIYYNINYIKKDLDYLSNIVNLSDIDFRLSFDIAGDILVPIELRKEILIKIEDNLRGKIEKLEKEFEDL